MGTSLGSGSKEWVPVWDQEVRNGYQSEIRKYRAGTIVRFGSKHVKVKTNEKVMKYALIWERG